MLPNLARAPLGQERPCRRELLNPVVAGVGHADVEAVVDRYALREAELACAATLRTPLRKERSRRGELLNPVVGFVDHIDVEAVVYVDACGIAPLAWTGPLATPLLLKNCSLDERPLKIFPPCVRHPQVKSRTQVQTVSGVVGSSPDRIAGSAGFGVPPHAGHGRA